MANCVTDYTNDFIGISAPNMYDKMIDEGHDPRFLLFSPSDDGTIKGGHKDPNNVIYWQIGCWGVTASCSEVLIL